VTFLIFLGAVFVWWTLGGLYARKQAISRNLQEQPSAAVAMVKGPFWVREMLIWSTLPPKSLTNASVDKVEESQVGERNRSVAQPVSVPDSPPEPASWAPEGTQSVSAPDDVSFRGRPAVESGATLNIGIPPLPDSQTPVVDDSASPAIDSLPFDLPSPVLPEEITTAPVPGRLKIDEPPIPAPGAPDNLSVAGESATDKPLATGHNMDQSGAIEQNPTTASIPSRPPAIKEHEIMPVPESPKKLPKQPRSGKVKVVCPWCSKKQKYAKDAMCPECNKLNPWLADKWGVMPSAQAEPEPIQEVDQVASNLPEAVSPQISAVDNQPATVAPLFEPLSAPPLPAEAMVAAPASSTVINNIQEEAVLLIPEGAVKPKKIPGKPFFGTTVKCLCPWCQSEKEYGKDAYCQGCGNQNPWLAAKWKLSNSSPATDPVSVLQEDYPKQNTATEETIPVNIPVVEEIVARPVEHPRPPVLSNVSTPQAEPVDPPDQPQQGQEKTDPENCPQCSRKAMADLNGACMFCGFQLEGQS